MGRLAATVIVRTMASKAAAIRGDKEVEISRLVKPIESEIEHNRRLVRDEKLSLENVQSDYAKLIRENNISFSEADGDVQMTIPKDGYKYVVSFNPSQIADSVNAADLSDQAIEDESASAEEDLQEEEDSLAEEEYGEDDSTPFQLTIQVQRDNVPNKKLVITAEATAEFEGKGYDLYVMDATIEKDAAHGLDYSGPSYDSLDEELREQIDQMVHKNFRKFVPLIADYARAKEAHLYQHWLQDFKEIVASPQ